MAFFRQLLTLIFKNFRIALLRHPTSTIIRAFILPVFLTAFLAYARNLFIPPSRYGISSSSPVKSLSDALHQASSGRDIVAFVNSGLTGGDIDHLIASLSDPIKAEGKVVEVLQQEDDLLTVCKGSLRGVSRCYGAAVFYSSPNEGSGGIWNYTLRADGALGIKIDVDKSTNDAEIYATPLQHAIDFAIASRNTTINQNSLPSSVMQYPYTSETEEQRETRIRTRFMSGIIQVLGVAFFISMVVVVYQLVGFMASEREMGMSQLIEAMMPNLHRWQPQIARLLSYSLAFHILYTPGRLLVSIILAKGIFTQTSLGIIIPFHFLAGLSLSSWSVFGGAFFKKAQLSGISLTIISLLLGVLAQVIATSGSGTIAILSLIFPPMNYVFFIIFLARWEAQDLGANLLKSAPDSPWGLPGIVLMLFLVIHTFVYFILGAFLERKFYGTASRGRIVTTEEQDNINTVELRNFTKEWRPNWIVRRMPKLLGKNGKTVLAVSDLTLTALKGQIYCLLGANGSGKSTTLDAICGLNTVTSGSIKVDGRGGLGVCPQKNILWPDLTVEEHVRIFNKLKSPSLSSKVSVTEIQDMILACDLSRKVQAKAKTLSGGQKRKLQLAMTFTGGSRVCCVDEVSSGLDPLSRRKIWDILLAERGARSIILTTHFLDEAELLADHIAILSKGKLKAEGSSVELKNTLGDGYRITVSSTATKDLPEFPGTHKGIFDQHTSYTTPNSSKTSEVVQLLDKMGIQDYQVSGPTIEDVFLKVADEVKLEQQRPGATNMTVTEKGPISNVVVEEKSAEIVSERSNESERGIQLLPGRRIGMPRQSWVLFRKRMTILRRNYLPHLSAFLLPVIAAGLVTLFLKGYVEASCNPADLLTASDIHDFETEIDLDLVIGPSDRLTASAFSIFQNALPAGTGSESSIIANFTNSLHTVDTLTAFNQYIDQNFANVTPGGAFLGDSSSPPTFAYRGDADLYSAVLVQNVLDTFLTNISITTQYSAFDTPFAPITGKALELTVYFGLAMSTYPAFFALYPTIERLRNVRALQYSNGVRALPLWLAYFAFDSCFIVLISAISTIIFAATSGIWYHVGYLFVVFTTYGMASAVMSYFVSLFSSSQLAAFAVAAGLQSVMFLLYFIGYLSILTYAPTQSVDQFILIFHFSVATITPSGNLIRAMFVALNVFSVTCKGTEFAPNPGAITLYGGPIAYTILQTVFLLVVLVWWDSGSLVGKFRKDYRNEDLEEKETVDQDVTEELQRVTSSNDGLRVLHLSKNFKSVVAVQDLTFGVKRGEVFALLGPNGAGKSTTISLIRGDIRPSQNGGEIFVENYSVGKHRAAARAHLGVCPQFDAMDQMTAIEQLRFYAQVRGVNDVDYNVKEVIRAVGLEAFSERMAAKLSGGNKRKLSLGVALMGNPTVLLLDEPSSGMDAAAKRVMWKTLAAVVPGRSLVLTTHSMEEADALANRAGIMAGKMLALGTSDSLRRKHGDAYHVHLVTKTAPHTSDEEMDRIRTWIQEHFPNAEAEDKTYHGQLKFSIPVAATRLPPVPPPSSCGVLKPTDDDEISKHSSVQKGEGISALFMELENAKESLGLEHYSVSRTTLDQVFLSIVSKHAIEEENAGEEAPSKKKKRFFCL